jgi:hypothetical protein
MNIMACLQVHPNATEEDIATLFSCHGEVLDVNKAMTLSEHGPHCTGQVVMSRESDAQVCM